MMSFEKLKSDWNQTWFMDTIWDPLYVHAVRGHTEVQGHQSSSCKMGSKCKITSFEKLKSDWNRAIFKY